MRSRVLIGVGAWLLGAVGATTGSLYAVDHLGQGLFGQNNKQVTVAMVNAEVALENAERATPSASPSPSPSPSASPSPHKTRHRVVTKPTAHPPTPLPTGSAGQLLTSADGTAVAVCKPGGAYLLSWSPQQSFEADNVLRGPAPTASVTFRGSSGGVVMKVSCVNGKPVDHLTPFQWHDE